MQKLQSTTWTILGISLILTACSKGVSNDARHAVTYESRHPITLAEKTNNIEVPINLNNAEFTLQEEAKIKSYLYQFDTKSTGNLIVTVPETGLKAGPARQSVRNIVEIARKVGIDDKRIRVGTYKPMNDTVGGVRMSFEAVIAEAPDCSNMWSENLSDAYNNEVSKGFGCATRNNLAAMIANPSDLNGMRNMGPGNGARRVDSFDKYVLGQTTSASRDSNETATATAQ